MMLLLNRAFFGLQLPRIPTLVAGANLAFNTALYLVLYPVGVWGVPLAISIANIAGAAALVVLLQRQVGGLELRRSTDAFLRITAASAALGAVSYAVWWVLDDVFGRSFLGQVVSVGRRGRGRWPGVPRRVPRTRGARDADATLVAGALPALVTPWTRAASATSRSSPTSTTGSRRWPTASWS